VLPVKTVQPYTPQGLFAANRKFDIHTGLDLYCEPQALIRCIADGYVKEVIDFTGVKAGSSWWHDTQAVAVQLPNGIVMVYGELLSAVQPQQKVYEGQILGWAEQVLLQDKGVNPPCMLHFELWTSGYQSNCTWLHAEPKPKGLINPLCLFNFWVVKTPYGYRIETHDGHYWRHFSSAIDCKSYCMWRSEEFQEKYVYVDPIKLSEYEMCTNKR
jgi:murein DD-endopeptidase MepM/ murein hydrolase activator NlpD